MNREKDWEWVKIKVYPKDKEIIEQVCGFGSVATRAEWLVEEFAEYYRTGKKKLDELQQNL